MDNAPIRPVIRTQRDLQDVWIGLMADAAYERQHVWWLLIEPDGRPIPQVFQLEDADAVPTTEQCAGFARLFTSLKREFPDLRLAFLLSRPGRDRVRADDLAWAQALYDVAARAGVACEALHLANEAGVMLLDDRAAA